MNRQHKIESGVIAFVLFLAIAILPAFRRLEHIKQEEGARERRVEEALREAHESMQQTHRMAEASKMFARLEAELRRAKKEGTYDLQMAIRMCGEPLEQIEATVGSNQLFFVFHGEDLGDVYAELGEQEKAMSAYTRAVEAYQWLGVDAGRIEELRRKMAQFGATEMERNSPATTSAGSPR